MKKITLSILAILSLAAIVSAGSWTSNQFIYKPSLGAGGQDQKDLFDAGMDRVDSRLGKEVWVGDSQYPTLDGILATGPTSGTIVVPAGTHTLSSSSNRTLASGLTLQLLRGAIIGVPTGRTLTISGSLEAGPYQIFSCAGTGRVVFGAGAVKEVLPEWWATNTTPGTTDMTTALQAAITATPFGGTLRLANKYKFSTALTATNLIHITGNGALSTLPGYFPQATLVKAAALNGTGLSLTHQGSRLDGVFMYGEEGNGGDGIVADCNGVAMSNVTVDNMGQDGIVINGTTNGNSFYLERIKSTNNTRYGMFIDSASGGPDVNAGSVINLEVTANGSDGLRVDRAHLNSFINILAAGNGGWGVNFTANATNNRMYGGDQDEANVSGSVQDLGVGNVFYGVSEPSSSFAGTGSYYNRLQAKVRSLLSIDSIAGPAATLSSQKASTAAHLTLHNTGTTVPNLGTNISLTSDGSNAAQRNWAIITTGTGYGDFSLRQSNAKGGDPVSAGTDRLYIDVNGKIGNTTTPKSNLHITGLPQYANNAAAVAGGLTAGAFYRTGGDPDAVCVVH